MSGQLMLWGKEASGAEISTCRRYRYRLWRRFGDGPALCVIGLNPSTADETVDDPTVVRCVRRARSWGYGALVLVNLFAWRATDPLDLAVVDDPVGPEGNRAIIAEAADCGGALCAWGTHGRLRGRGAEVEGLLRRMGAPLYVLRLNGDGSPAHPLYLPYSLRPVRW